MTTPPRRLIPSGRIRATIILTPQEVERFEGNTGYTIAYTEPDICQHKWVQIRHTKMWREVVLKVRWVDGPDEVAGDVIKVDGAGPWIASEREPTVDKIICQECGTIVHEGDPI